MNDNHIEIKERRASLVAKGIIFLFLAVFSLSIALLPYIIDEFKNNALTFYLAGGIAFCFFATMFIFLLFKECKPDNIIVLNSRGFIDNKNVGPNIEIEWTNVATVKLMGKKETPYLGITLENSDLVMAHMKKQYVEEMRENIEEGLPHILLSQKEIRYPINELKDLFVKFAREARALKNDVPSKPKNNPFTTEDVLRAFGQLEPLSDDNKEEEAAKTESKASSESNQSNEYSYQNLRSSYSDESEIYDDEEDEKAFEEESGEIEEIKSVDSFYEMLLKKTETVNTDKNVEEQKTEVSESALEDTPVDNKPEAYESSSPDSQTENDEDLTEDIDAVLNEDIIELLSKAKSSKISEIEKLLNEKDVPYSAVRKEDTTFEVHFDPPEESDKPDEATFVADLNESKSSDNMGDTKEFYPEIIHFDDI